MRGRHASCSRRRDIRSVVIIVKMLLGKNSFYLIVPNNNHKIQSIYNYL